MRVLLNTPGTKPMFARDGTTFTAIRVASLLEPDGTLRAVVEYPGFRAVTLRVLPGDLFPTVETVLAGPFDEYYRAREAALAD